MPISKPGKSSAITNPPEVGSLLFTNPVDVDRTEQTQLLSWPARQQFHNNFTPLPTPIMCVSLALFHLRSRKQTRQKISEAGGAKVNCIIFTGHVSSPKHLSVRCLGRCGSSESCWVVAL